MASNFGIFVVLLTWLVFVHGDFFLRQSGDAIIGQMLPLHKSSDGSKCSELDMEKIIEVEALIYAANKIKSEDSGLRIGYDVVDTCAESSSKTKDRLESATRTWFEDEKNISRVPVAVITNLNHKSDFIYVGLHVPTSSVPLISLKPRQEVHPYTYSMEPDPGTADRAIVKLVKHFQWNILDALVYEDDREFQNFKKVTEDNNVCLINELFVSKSDIGYTSKRMKKGKGEASVLVVFSPLLEFPQLLTELDRYNLSSREFILGTEISGDQDSWDDNVRGILGIRRNSGNLKDFDKHLAASKLLDTWLNETFCGNRSMENCDHSGQKHMVIKKFSWRGSSVIDAVYAVAEAVKSGSGRLPKTGLTGIRVTSATGRVVSFGRTKNIDEVKYDVLNFQEGVKQIKIVRVGEIDISKKIRLSVRETNIAWRNADAPLSRCSENCRPGTRRRPWDDATAKCCWDCVHCEPGTVSSYSNSTRCLKCPAGSKPTADQTKCQPPYVDYLRWHEPFSLVMIFLLAFTICFLVYAVNLYVKKASTPVFAKSKCASLPLLLSLFVTFVLPVLLLMKPTESSCGAYYAIFVFSLGIPLTFLIARSHVLHNYCYDESGQLRRKWFRFSPQTMVSFFFVMTQVILVIILLNVFPAKVIVYSTSEPDVEYIECSYHSKPEFIPGFFFILFVVLLFNILHANEVCSPENQNEVKFVSFAIYLMYNLLFVYFVAIYGMKGKGKVMVLCGMSFLLGLNFLVTIFLPKVYVILFKPEKNLPEERSLLRDDDENGNSARLVKRDLTDSPSPELHPGQYDRTEV